MLKRLVSYLLNFFSPDNRHVLFTVFLGTVALFCLVGVYQVLPLLMSWETPSSGVYYGLLIVVCVFLVGLFCYGKYFLIEIFGLRFKGEYRLSSHYVRSHIRGKYED